MDAQLPDLSERLRDATHAIERLLTTGGDAAVAWRPREDRWSMVEHAAHLNLVHGPYVEAIRSSLAGARREGRTGTGPFRGRWLGRTFAGLMRPPVKRRLKTQKRMVPPPAAELSPPVIRERFGDIHRTLGGLLDEAGSIDLDRTFIRSPFAGWLRLTVIDAFRLLVYHTERHLWLLREVADDSSFPGEAA